ncbi:MAG: DUF6291 domain-containing protein [Lachnospiraceae bacterium]|nr:DUF6291 domain-containing protein [Lachnospiraceae bacterium]
MADNVTFVVHKEWLDSIQGLPVEQQDKILAEIVRYGTDSGTVHDDDPVVNAFVNILKSRIDFSKNKYNQKIEMSKSAGRKKKVDDDEILRLAREGKTSSQIAEILGCSKSSIDHSDGWKMRNQKPVENPIESEEEDVAKYNGNFVF